MRLWNGLWISRSSTHLGWIEEHPQGRRGAHAEWNTVAVRVQRQVDTEAPHSVAAVHEFHRLIQVALRQDRDVNLQDKNFHKIIYPIPAFLNLWNIIYSSLFINVIYSLSSFFYQLLRIGNACCINKLVQNLFQLMACHLWVSEWLNLTAFLGQQTARSM